jgi:hypothetical protein
MLLTQVKIASAGGIELIVAAARAHIANAALSEEACRALRNLARDNDANKVCARMRHLRCM